MKNSQCKVCLAIVKINEKENTLRKHTYGRIPNAKFCTNKEIKK